MKRISICLSILIMHLAASTGACQEKAVLESKSVAVYPALASAQKNLKRAKRDYEQLRRLVTRGSGSRTELRRALLVKQIAELQLAAIEKPGFATDYARKGAKLKSEYARKEFEISSNLYRRGSVSEIRYRKRKHAYQIAKVELAMAEGKVEEEQGDLQIAKLELRQAEFEFQSAKRLLQKGSLKRSTYDQVRDRLLEAKANLEDLQFEDT